jgi:hypothetical protein
MKTLQVYTRARTTVFFTRHVEVPDDFPEADYGDVVRRLCGWGLAGLNCLQQTPRK